MDRHADDQLHSQLFEARHRQSFWNLDLASNQRYILKEEKEVEDILEEAHNVCAMLPGDIDVLGK